MKEGDGFAIASCTKQLFLFADPATYRTTPTSAPTADYAPAAHYAPAADQAPAAD
jgi:hypothetical protein